MLGSEHRFFVGAWIVDPGTHTLTAPNGTAHKLEPKAIDILRCLAEYAPETVTRSRLLEWGWGDTVVEENALSRTVSQLRKAFDDDPRAPRFIETIPKRGYRLIAPIQFGGDSHQDVPVDLELPRRPAPTRPFPWLRYGAVAAVVLLAAAGGFAVARWTQPALTPLGVVPFTSLPGIEQDPAFSPDGRFIAFTSRAYPTGNADLYVQSLDAAPPRRLTESPEFEYAPTWSPDGGRIAFLRRSESTCGLFTVSIQGDTPRKWHDCPPGGFHSIDWSADGRIAVAARTHADSSLRIAFLDPDAGSLAFVSHPGASNDYGPRFSPDGEEVAFVRNFGGGRDDLFSLPVAGGPERRITGEQRYVAGADWTPDGDHFIVSSNRGGLFQLWQVRTRDRTVSWFPTAGTYDPGTPRVAPATGDLSYVEWFFDFNIHRLQAAGGAWSDSILIASTQWDRHPGVSPDGRRVAFTSNRSGATQLWMYDVTGGRATVWTALDDRTVSSPRWAPDGRYLAFTLTDASGGSDLFTMEAEGGPLRPMTDHPADDRDPTWSRDGQWIYFSSDRSGERELWKVPAEGGTAVRVTGDGGLFGHESVDGRWFYYARSSEAGLWRRPIDGDAAEQVTDLLSRQDWGNWMPTQRGLYFVQRTAQGATLMRIAGDDQVETLFEFPTVPVFSEVGLSATPDGDAVYVALIDRLESDVMLVPAAFPARTE